MSLEISKSNSKAEQICLQKFKDFITENRTLEEFSELLTDEFLLHFVRGKKYDSEKAYSALQNYINIRKVKYRDMFCVLTPSACTALDMGSVRILKNRDHLSRVVTLTRIKCWDPKQYSSEEYMKMVVLCIEEMWEYIDAERNGIIVIFDFDGYNLQHTMALTIPVIMKYINILWNNFPLRPQAVHFVNEIYLVTLLLKTIKPLLPLTIRKRLNCHGTNFESFHKHVLPSTLPEFLGGSLPEDEAFDLTFEQKIRAKEDFYQKFASKLKK